MPQTPIPKHDLIDPGIVAIPGPEEAETDKLVNKELSISEALPGLMRGQGTAILIDSNNLYRRAKSEGFQIDYVKLKNIFASRCDLRHCSIFSAVNPEDHRAQDWISFLTAHGIIPITKPVRRMVDDNDTPYYKGNMDVDLVIEAMSLSEGFAHVVIGSCDGDFVPLINALRKGRYRTVSVMGISNHLGKGMSEDLAKSGDHFYDLWKIKDYITVESNRR